MTNFAYTGAALNNLVGNTPGANVSNLVQLLNDLKTFLNGANLDGTNIAGSGVAAAQIASNAVTLPKLSVKVMFGTVTSAGAISSAGSGDWTSVRSSAGIYVVTPGTPFGAVPAVTVTCGPTGGVQFPTLTAMAAGSFTINTIVSNTGGLSDSGFAFNAIGIR